MNLKNVKMSTKNGEVCLVTSLYLGLLADHRPAARLIQPPRIHRLYRERKGGGVKFETAPPNSLGGGNHPFTLTPLEVLEDQTED